MTGGHLHWYPATPWDVGKQVDPGEQRPNPQASTHSPLAKGQKQDEESHVDVPESLGSSSDAGSTSGHRANPFSFETSSRLLPGLPMRTFWNGHIYQSHFKIRNPHVFSRMSAVCGPKTVCGLDIQHPPFGKIAHEEKA